MKEWMEKYKEEIITIVIITLVLAIGAFITMPYKSEYGLTLSKMEKMAENYPPAWVDGL